jgi:hypothetical protein
MHVVDALGLERSAIIERELRKSQRVFGDIESAFASQSVGIRPVSGPAQ